MKRPETPINFSIFCKEFLLQILLGAQHERLLEFAFSEEDLLFIENFSRKLVFNLFKLRLNLLKAL